MAAVEQEEGKHHVAAEDAHFSEAFLQSFASLKVSPKKTTGFSAEEKRFLLQCVSIYLELATPLTSDVNFQEAFGDGVLLAKLLNRTAVNSKGPIDEATVVPPTGDPHSQKAQFGLNQNRAAIIKSIKDKRLACAAAVTSEAIQAGEEDVILTLIWELVKTHMLKDIRAHSEIDRLLQWGEKKNLAGLDAEMLLLRWVNFQLFRSRHGRHQGMVVSNFGKDLSDSAAYTTLLFEIDRKKCPTLALLPPDMAVDKRAALTVAHASALGCNRFLTETAILDGIEMINIAFLADLFTHFPNFVQSYQPPAEPLLKWINSLGVVDIANHLTDMSDGVAWARITDKVMHGSVDWKKVVTANVNNIKKRSNCEYMAALIKEKFQLKMSLTQEDLFTGVADRVNPALEEMMKYDTKHNGYHP